MVQGKISGEEIEVGKLWINSSSNYWLNLWNWIKELGAMEIVKQLQIIMFLEQQDLKFLLYCLGIYSKRSIFS